MAVEPDIPWRVGFEVEVVLGELGDPRFNCELDGPMDVASLEYCKAVARRLAEATGYQWKARNTGTRWSRPGFYVVSEYDLDPLDWPYGRYAGVELLTPPLPLEEAEAARSAMRDAILDLDGDFNFWRSDVTEGCAWHVNIDGGSGVRLDPSHYALTVDELPILVENGRAYTRYTGLQRHAYGVALLRHLQVEPQGLLLDRCGLENLIDQASGYGKRYAANFEKTTLGYLELRHFSAQCFFGDEPLTDLLQPFMQGIGLPWNRTIDLEGRMREVFGILATWLKLNLPRFSFEIGGYGFTHAEGRAMFDGEPLASLSFNGLGEVRLLQNTDGRGTYAVHGAEFSNVPHVLALLALDLAELKLAGRRLRPMLNKAFKQEVDALTRSLRHKNLSPSDHRRRVVETWNKVRNSSRADPAT